MMYINILRKEIRILQKELTDSKRTLPRDYTTSAKAQLERILAKQQELFGMLNDSLSMWHKEQTALMLANPHCFWRTDAYSMISDKINALFNLLLRTEKDIDDTKQQLSAFRRKSKKEKRAIRDKNHRDDVTIETLRGARDKLWDWLNGEEHCCNEDETFLPIRAVLLLIGHPMDDE